jgi:hypothetical protein
LGYDGAMSISLDCRTQNNSQSTDIGHPSVSYENDTGRDGTTFFTGESNLTVKELEVFHLVDETIDEAVLPASLISHSTIQCFLLRWSSAMNVIGITRNRLNPSDCPPENRQSVHLSS